MVVLLSTRVRELKRTWWRGNVLHEITVLTSAIKNSYPMRQCFSAATNAWGIAPPPGRVEVTLESQPAKEHFENLPFAGTQWKDGKQTVVTAQASWGYSFVTQSTKKIMKINGNLSQRYFLIYHFRGCGFWILLFVNTCFVLHTFWVMYPWELRNKEALSLPLLLVHDCHITNHGSSGAQNSSALGTPLAPWCLPASSIAEMNLSAIPR